MKSSPKMIFHCSIQTLEKIFEDDSFARGLCETKAQRLLSWKPDFDIVDSDSDTLTVEYHTKSGGGDYWVLSFAKVSDTVIKCQVSTTFRWGIWIAIIVLSFLSEFIFKFEWGSAIGMLTIMALTPFAIMYKMSIEKIGSRIKKNYERSETFLKLNNHLSNEIVTPKINYR